MTEFRNRTVAELLQLHSRLMDELRSRDVVRSSNNPTGDYGELLFARAFNWTLNANSSADADAVDSSGVRYQIKARRLTPANSSRQLGFIRRLPDRPFDKLAAVLLDSQFRVMRSALIPYEVVVTLSRYVDSVRAWRMLLRDTVWDIEGVIDVTKELLEAEQNI